MTATTAQTNLDVAPRMRPARQGGRCRPSLAGGGRSSLPSRTGLVPNVPPAPATPATGVARAAVDRSVVHLSLTDTPRSLRPHSIRRDILRAIFGWRPANGFADPRLEALRVYAVTYRTSHNRDEDANRAKAIAAGLEPTTLAEARRIIDAHIARRQGRARRSALAVAMTLLAAILLWGQRRLAEALGDPLAAWILIGVAAASMLPWLQRLTVPTERR